MDYQKEIQEIMDQVNDWPLTELRNLLGKMGQLVYDIEEDQAITEF